MRVKKLLFLLVLLTIAGRAAADELSVSSPVTLVAGATQEFALSFNATNTYSAYQFDLILPKGVTVTDKRLEGSRIEVDMSKFYVSHTLEMSDGKTDSDGKTTYTFLSYSSSNVNLKGTSGALLYIKISAGNDVSGTLSASIENIKFAASGASGSIGEGSATLSDVAFDITVQGLPKVTAVDKEITYGEAVPAFDFICEDGLADGDKPASSLTLQTAEGTPVTYDASTKLDAGTYTIVVPASADNKYVAVNGTLTVKQKVLEFDLTQQVKATYSARNQRQQPVITNLTNDERKMVHVQTDTQGKETKDVGTYTLIVKGVNNKNYAIPSGDFSYEFVIEPYDISNLADTKFKLTATLGDNDKTITYDGNVHTPQPTVEAKFLGSKEGEEFQADVTGLKFGYSFAEPKDVGTYQITSIDANGSKNFKGVRSLTDVSFEITKAAGVDVTVTANEGLTYSGSPKQLVTPPTEVVGGTLVYALAETDAEPADENYSETIPTGTDSKTYKVWYKVRGDGNHNDTAPKSVEVTIGKAAATVEFTGWGSTLTYNGNDQLLVENDKFTVNGGSLVFVDEDNTTEIPEANIKGKDAGEYTIRYKVKGNANHSDSEVLEVKRKIEPKELILNWQSTELVYNGKTQKPNLSLSGLINGDNDGGRTWEFEGDRVNVGTGYKATLKNIGNTNYRLPAEGASTTFSITAYDISTAPEDWLTKETVSAIEFDEAIHKPVPKVRIQFEKKDAIIDVTFSKYTYKKDRVEVAEPKGYGTYEIYAEGTGNFKGTLRVGEFQITKTLAKTATVTAKELSFTGEAQMLIDVDASTLVGGTMLYKKDGDADYSADIPKATNAGTYKVYYKVAPSESYDYVVDETRDYVEVTIAKVAATISLPENWAEALAYNGADQQLPDDSKFVKNGGTEVHYIVDGTDTTDPASVTGKDAKTYTFKYYLKGDANHSDSEQKEATRVINPLVATLTWSNTALTYNGAVQVPTAEVSNKINGDACEVTVEGGAKEYKAEGTYTATATALSNANYQLPETKTQAFTIAQYDIKENKAKLTIAAIDKVNYTGQEHKPVPTVTAEGITGDVTVTYTYADNINVGTGKVKIEGTGNFKGVLESTDFDAESKTLTFEIDKAAGTAATVTAKTGLVYNGGAQELITVTGDVTEGCKMMYKVDDATGFAETLPTAIKAGTYTVSWYLDGGANYGSTTAVNVTVEIAKATLTVTADDKFKEYGADDPAFTLTYGTFLGSDTKENDIQTEPTAAVSGEHVNAGEYNIAVTGGAADNYTFEYVTGKLTITKKTVGLSWSNTSFTYNNKEQAPTATATGLVGTDECTVTVSGAKKDYSAEAYTATATGLSNSNYQLPTEGTTQAFTIAQADFSDVVLNPATLSNVTYNGRDQKPTVAVTFGSEEVFTLDAATEYTVSYKLGDETVTSLTDAGTYTVVIDSKEKNFSAGQKTLTQTIDKANLSAATVSVSGMEYTGTALTPTPTVTINGTTVPASEYTVTSYENNINIGTATVTVTAAADSKNFTAGTTATGSFSIYEPYVPPTFSTDEGSDIDAYPTSNDEVTVTQLSAGMLNGTEEIPSELNSSEGGTYKVTEVASSAFRNMPADVVLTLPEGVKTSSPVKNVINGDGTCKELDLTQVKNFEPAKTLTVEKVTYKRQVKTEAITVCMPYEVDVPEGVTAYVLKGDTEGKVTFDLLEGTKVPAYLPCMLRREVPAGARRNGLTAPEAVTIDLSARNVVVNPSAGDEVMKRDDFELCGTTTGLTHKEGYDLQAFILQPDMTWKMTASSAVEDAEKQYLAPFQAYLCSTRAISGSIDMQLDSTTGIDAVINDNGEMMNDNEGWYDLNGHKLAGKPTTKGIYVKNGRKVVIK